MSGSSLRNFFNQVQNSNPPSCYDPVLTQMTSLTQGDKIKFPCSDSTDPSVPVQYFNGDESPVPLSQCDVDLECELFSTCELSSQEMNRGCENHSDSEAPTFDLESSSDNDSNDSIFSQSITRDHVPRSVMLDSLKGRSLMSTSISFTESFDQALFNPTKHPTGQNHDRRKQQSLIRRFHSDYNSNIEVLDVGAQRITSKNPVKHPVKLSSTSFDNNDRPMRKRRPPGRFSGYTNDFVGNGDWFEDRQPQSTNRRRYNDSHTPSLIKCRNLSRFYDLHSKRQFASNNINRQSLTVSNRTCNYSRTWTANEEAGIADFSSHSRGVLQKHNPDLTHSSNNKVSTDLEKSLIDESLEPIFDNESNSSVSGSLSRRRHLLNFIIELLNHRYSCVEWINRQDRIFQISNPEQLTRLWGQYKKNIKMTFESLSRSLRLYYAPKKLERIQGRRHQYRLLHYPSRGKSRSNLRGRPREPPVHITNSTLTSPQILAIHSTDSWSTSSNETIYRVPLPTQDVFSNGGFRFPSSYNAPDRKW